MLRNSNSRMTDKILSINQIFLCNVHFNFISHFTVFICNFAFFKSSFYSVDLLRLNLPVKYRYPLVCSRERNYITFKGYTDWHVRY